MSLHRDAINRYIRLDSILVYKTLKAVKDNDGFPGPVPVSVRNYLVPRFAEVEVSPYTGLDIQWKLTSEGKKELRRLHGEERYRQKRRKWELAHPDRLWGGGYSGAYTHPAVVPMTIEVLDALKAIRDTGEPQTEKLEILARIQRDGGDGKLAEHKDGVWSLTLNGKARAASHIRKAQCAQFGGKVR